jgi:hypothetical protein
MKPLVHNNIYNTPLRLVQEGTVSTAELCSSLGGEPSTREESAPEVSGWQWITTEIITMAETLALGVVT